MNLFREDDDRYKLFAQLSKADSSTFLGHSIISIVNSCESAYDFDWLVTQLKDYVMDADTRTNFIHIVGIEVCDLINNYKPFKNDT